MCATSDNASISHLKLSSEVIRKFKLDKDFAAIAMAVNKNATVSN